MSADSQSTALSRSLASLPSDYRARLEASNLPIEIAVAIADAVDVARRSEKAAQPDHQRDIDWVLAMGHALGMDSGLNVPIVPDTEAFKALFAALKSVAAPNGGDDTARLDWLQQGDTRFYNLDRITSIVGRGFKADSNFDWRTGIRQAIDEAMKQTHERN